MSRNTQRLLLGRLFQLMLAIPVLLLLLYIAVISYHSSAAVQVGASVFAVLLLTVLFYTVYRHRTLRS